MAALGLCEAPAQDDDAEGGSTAPDVDTFYLWPENVQAFTHWQCVQTQWRVGGMGGVTGLDYAGVRAYLELCGPRSSREREALFRDFMVMEGGALPELNRRRNGGG